MAVKDLITQIYNEIPLASFEMEYDYETDAHTIDLRLYGANIEGAKTIAEIIANYEFTGVTGVKAETPSKQEIDYAFSGYQFVRVTIEIDRNVARGTKDRFLFNDAGRMI